MLAPGDMLYLPPRWAHDGIAEGEAGGEDTLRLLREELRRHPGHWAAFEPLPEGLA